MICLLVDVPGMGLSSALGMARDQSQQNQHVIAVIDDASLTNGLTLEAFNSIGKPRIIVLNDNSYSISENCFRYKLKHFGKITGWGNHLDIYIYINVSKNRTVVLKPSSLRKYWRLEYIWPIDGHNITELHKKNWNSVSDKTVLLHVYL
jgi:deoxyxylulose-5-phosphate synthase